jgi:hypothetical protein
MNRIRTAGVALVATIALTTGVQAQHIDQAGLFEGAWEVTFSSQMGPMTMTFHLEQDMHAINGVASSQMGESVVEGVQEGEDVTFTMFVVQPDHEVNLDFTGTVHGDTAEGAVSIMGEAYEWTAKRADGR